MTGLLLDTHALLWALSGEDRLGPATTRALTDTRRPTFVSAVSAWEIEIKRAAGRLEAPAELRTVIEQSGFELLPLDPDQAILAGRLPLLHRDPFDRALVAQATLLSLTLVTDDARIAAYDVATMAASGR